MKAMHAPRPTERIERGAGAVRVRDLLPVLLCLCLAIASVQAAEPSNQIARFSVEGMHCSGCASGIQAILKRTSGVRSAEVDYEKRQAVVEYDPQKVTTAKLAAAIEKLGYKTALLK